MNLKRLVLATRLPFVTASLFPVILYIAWCAVYARKFNMVYALLCLIGIILIHIGANTINDYFDWNFSDASNPNVSRFNGGTRGMLGDSFPRSLFLSISLICIILLAFIALTFILRGRIFVIYFSLAGLVLVYLYSSPPFRFHSRGLGEILIFLAHGPVLSAAVCYVMTGGVRPLYFIIGLPAGLSTLAILWINQFPDYDSDKTAGKKNLTVTFGLKASRYFYVLLILSVYISVALLIVYHIFSIWSAMIMILVPGIIKAVGILFRDYRHPKELLPVQGFTIRFHLLSILLIAAGLILGNLIYY